jgi:hypothetical protein
MHQRYIYRAASTPREIAMGDPSLRPVCFMVMPFGTKPVLPRPEGAPEKIDFDALWNKALAPLIDELGYEPVRADQDTGAAIILEMLERLYFSDLVVADMTLPNGNVYYEVGIRHACKASGCLLISAQWSAPLFDSNQMRRLVYPLAEGSITDATAAAVRDALRGGAGALAEGASPMYQHIPGFPDPGKVDPQRASTIRKQLDALAAFQARVRAVHLQRDAAQRRAGALALRDAHPAAATLSPSVAIDIVMLLRDAAGWQDCIAYIDALPQAISQLDLVQEQRSLALSKTGDHLQAIAALEALIQRRGDSAERQGLIGGRYKKLASLAQQAGDAGAWRAHLEQAIWHYEQGMQCDLNDYYPSCNLPRLYKARGDEGDEQRAAVAAQVAMLACERAKARGAQDEWLNPTLLGLAFDAGDAATARRLVADVRREGPAAWKLDSTLADLERSVAQVADAGHRAALTVQLQALRSIAGVQA